MRTFNNISCDISRRAFLGTVPALALSCAASRGPANPVPENKRKRVAAIMTVYRPGSHADVTVGRLLNGYEYYGQWRTPSVRVVSMYTDQVPDSDMSRDQAKKHQIPIRPTIREALIENGKLAVEGVVFIGEHGDYPYNERGQHLFPRYELFSEIVDAFKETGQVVPVFCDKHLSYEWKKAKQMYDWSRELGFPMMAGSSLPLCWREPALEIEHGTSVDRAVACCYSGKDIYGIHLLEALQSMVERRKGGESGIASVQCLESDYAWKWTDDHPWAGRLLDAALARCPSNPGSLRENLKEPILFVLEYRDGLQAAAYLLSGHISTTGFAADLTGVREPVSTNIIYQKSWPHSHFSGLAYQIERMMITGRPSYPVERTLLTTGTLAAAFDSSWESGRYMALGRRLDTPHLDIAYQGPKESQFNRGPMSADETRPL